MSHARPNRPAITIGDPPRIIPFVLAGDAARRVLDGLTVAGGDPHGPTEAEARFRGDELGAAHGYCPPRRSRGSSVEAVFQSGPGLGRPGGPQGRREVPQTRAGRLIGRRSPQWYVWQGFTLAALLLAFAVLLRVGA
jgi:hypothetical protein